MTDAGYIATGFTITFVVVASYLVSLRARLLRAQRAYQTLAPGDSR